MEDGEVNGNHDNRELDLVNLRETVLSNSTKRRTTELRAVHERLANKGALSDLVASIPALLLTSLQMYLAINQAPF